MLWIPGYFCLWPRKTLQSNENIPSDRGRHRWQVGRCGGRIRPKIFRRLKFPKTPFSHLWGALQCASSELNQNFKMYSWAAKCEMAWFCREPLLLSWTKVDRLNLSFYDYFTFLLRRQAARIWWCRIRSGCWPETFASAVFCHSLWVMLISAMKQKIHTVIPVMTGPLEAWAELYCQCSARKGWDVWAGWRCLGFISVD